MVTEIFVLFQRTVGHIRYQLADVPRQPDSPLDTVLRTSQSLTRTIYNRHTHTHNHPPPTTNDPIHPGFVEVLKHTTQRSQAPSPDSTLILCSPSLPRRANTIPSQADKPERLTDPSPRAINSFSWIITNTPRDGGKAVCVCCVLCCGACCVCCRVSVMCPSQ